MFKVPIYSSPFFNSSWVYGVDISDKKSNIVTTLIDNTRLITLQQSVRQNQNHGRKQRYKRNQDKL